MIEGPDRDDPKPVEKPKSPLTPWAVGIFFGVLVGYFVLWLLGCRLDFDFPVTHLSLLLVFFFGFYLLEFYWLHARQHASILSSQDRLHDGIENLQDRVQIFDLNQKLILEEFHRSLERLQKTMDILCARLSDPKTHDASGRPDVDDEESGW